MANRVSRDKLKEIKQGYRDEISSLRQQLRDYQTRLDQATKTAANAPKISQEAKDYRAQTQGMLSQAEAIRSGYSSQLASIQQQQKTYEDTMAARSAALTRQGEEQRAALTRQGEEQRKVAAEEAAVRSANQRRSELAPRLQIQPAGETPTTGGTQPFKRRKMQFGDTKPYGALAIKSNTLNV
jgi:chromosome segregation ATPase